MQGSPVLTSSEQYRQKQQQQQQEEEEEEESGEEKREEDGNGSQSAAMIGSDSECGRSRRIEAASGVISGILEANLYDLKVGANFDPKNNPLHHYLPMLPRQVILLMDFC